MSSKIPKISFFELDINNNKLIIYFSNCRNILILDIIGESLKEDTLLYIDDSNGLLKLTDSYIYQENINKFYPDQEFALFSCKKNVLISINRHQKKLLDFIDISNFIIKKTIPLSFTKEDDIIFMVNYINSEYILISCLEFKCYLLNLNSNKVIEINIGYSPTKIFYSEEKILFICNYEQSNCYTQIFSINNNLATHILNIYNLSEFYFDNITERIFYVIRELLTNNLYIVYSRFDYEKNKLIDVWKNKIPNIFITDHSYDLLHKNLIYYRDLIYLALKDKLLVYNFNSLLIRVISFNKNIFINQLEFSQDTLFIRISNLDKKKYCTDILITSTNILLDKSNDIYFNSLSGDIITAHVIG